MYFHMTENRRITEAELRDRHKNVSLPKVWTSETLNFLGVTKIVSTAQPIPGENEKVIPANPVLHEGVAREVWQVVPLFTEYTDDDGNTVTVQAQIDAKNASETAEKAFGARKDRDALLEETDGIAIGALETGVALSDEMLAYRQALRDVPQQEGFPSSITWPTKP